jgi:UDP-glucose 4-epimerase
VAYLVTGGTGLVGCYIVRDLIEAGEQVVVYDVAPNREALRAVLSEKDQNRPTIVQGDVLDFHHLLRTLKENHITNIIHMAYLLGRYSNENPPLAIRVNCEGTNNMFEACRILDLKTKLVYASTIAVFGRAQYQTKEPMKNDAPHHPFNVYTSCKSFDEQMARYYFELHGLDSVGLRFGVVYGVGGQIGHAAEGFAATLTREIMQNPAIGKLGNVPYGDDTMYWTYAEDLANLSVVASQLPPTKTKVFNVGGDSRTVKEAANYVKQLIPEAKLVLKSGLLNLCYDIDSTDLEKELGFKTKFNLEQGIKKTIEITRKRHSAM